MNFTSDMNSNSYNNSYILTWVIYIYLKEFGDWGLGIGDWGLGPIPNPQSPIPNPHCLSPCLCN